MDYRTQLMSYALVCLLGAMSPGPDFAVVTKYASLVGKQAGVTAALGVASGMAVNTAAAVLGLGAVLAASNTLYTVVKLVGAAYLVYLGVSGLIALRRGGSVPVLEGDDVRRTLRTAYVRGLVVNVANPKAVVFLVALMPSFLPQVPTVANRIALGVITVLVVLAWFVALAFAFSLLKGIFQRPRVRTVLDAFSGSVLIVLGLKIALD